MNVDVTLRELDAAERRLKNQEQLLAISKEVSDKASAEGSHALARMANTRIRRQTDAIADTKKVIDELRKMLPPPPAELKLGDKTKR